MTSSERERRIYQLTDQLRGNYRTKSIYENWKKGYEEFNTQLGNYSKTVETALDNIFAAGESSRNGGFISGTEILGGESIPNIYRNLESAKNSVSSLNSFCLRKINEFQKEINNCDLNIRNIQTELYSLRS